MFYKEVDISYEERCLEKAKEELKKEDPFWYLDSTYSQKLKVRYTQIQTRALRHVQTVSECSYSVATHIIPRIPLVVEKTEEVYGLVERNESWTDQILSLDDGIYVMSVGQHYKGRAKVKLYQYQDESLNLKSTFSFVFKSTPPSGGVVLRMNGRYLQTLVDDKQEMWVQTHSMHSKTYKEFCFSKANLNDPMCYELDRQPMFVLPKKFTGMGGQFCPLPSKALFVSSAHYRYESPIVAFVEVVHARPLKAYFRVVSGPPRFFRPEEIVTPTELLQFITAKVQEGFKLFTCYEVIGEAWAGNFDWWIPPQLDKQEASVSRMEQMIPLVYRMECERLQLLLRHAGIMSYLDPMTMSFSCYYQWKGWQDAVLALAWSHEWKPYYRGKGKAPVVIGGTYIEFPQSMQELVRTGKAVTFFSPVLDEIYREILRKSEIMTQDKLVRTVGEPFPLLQFTVVVDPLLIGIGRFPAIRFPIIDLESPAQRICRMCPLFKPVHLLFKHGQKHQWKFEVSNSWCRHSEFCGCQLTLWGPMKVPLQALGDSMTSKMYFLLMTLLQLMHMMRPRLSNRSDCGEAMVEEWKIDWCNSLFDPEQMRPGLNVYGLLNCRPPESVEDEVVAENNG